MLAPTRAERLAARAPAFGPARNDAELAAVAWACEMTALERLRMRWPSAEFEWADFDAMLEDMPSALGRAAEPFRLRTPTSQRSRAIADGPLMSRYSKALEYEYSARAFAAT